MGASVKRLRLLPFSLWFALNHALPRHPLMWYRSVQRPSREPSAYREGLLQVIIIILITLGMLIWVLTGFAIELLPLVSGFVVCFIIPRAVAHRITHENERGWLDLLAVTPPGIHSAYWAIATRYFRTDENFQSMDVFFSGMHALMMLCVIPLTVVSVLALMNPFSFRYIETLQVFTLTGNTILWLILIRADYLYSLTQSALMAMITATLTRSRLEASYGAMFAAFIVQTLTYILILIAGRSVLAMFGAGGELTWLASSLLWLMTFFLVREACLYGVCYVLARRFDITVRELLNLFRSSL